MIERVLQSGMVPKAELAPFKTETKTLLPHNQRSNLIRWCELYMHLEGRAGSDNKTWEFPTADRLNYTLGEFPSLKKQLKSKLRFRYSGLPIDLLASRSRQHRQECLWIDRVADELNDPVCKGCMKTLFAQRIAAGTCSSLESMSKRTSSTTGPTTRST